jgi:hypothetical protein
MPIVYSASHDEPRCLFTLRPYRLTRCPFPATGSFRGIFANKFPLALNPS